jgi:hypothetical protein
VQVADDAVGFDWLVGHFLTGLSKSGLKCGRDHSPHPERKSQFQAAGKFARPRPVVPSVRDERVAGPNAATLGTTWPTYYRNPPQSVPNSRMGAVASHRDTTVQPRQSRIPALPRRMARGRGPVKRRMRVVATHTGSILSPDWQRSPITPM